VTGGENAALRKGLGRHFLPTWKTFSARWHRSSASLQAQNPLFDARFTARQLSGPEHAVDALLYFCRHRVSQHDQFTVRNSFSACSKSTGISTKRKLKE
jgi:hypothetical protein